MNCLETFRSRHYSSCLLICYWLLGLCNNFAYVVMLSAAHDILSDHSSDNKTTPSSNSTPSNHTNKYNCNDISTGAILLADIIPGILIKLVAPFFAHRLSYSSRVALVTIGNAASFLLVALTPSNLEWLTFIGVCFASLSSGFGEITFLSLSTLYDRRLALTGWGSGTGAAGVGGSLSYAGLTAAGVSPRNSILIMLFIPVLLAASYIVLPSYKTWDDTAPIITDAEQNASLTATDGETRLRHSTNSEVEQVDADGKEEERFSEKFKKQLKLLRSLQKYMIPLFLVYFAEYFINQGLFELLYFKNTIFKTHKDQYRWYNVCYQLAVFVSRTSIAFIQIKFLPIFPILQLLNVGIVLSQIFIGYIPSIWIVFVIIFWEGLLGGGCYVNAFNQVSIEVPKNIREFAIAITSVADSFGITIAGFLAIPVHNAICKYGES